MYEPFFKRQEISNHKIYTVKRAIIIWKNNNKQVKLFVLGLEFSHSIMISCFQDFLHLLRTRANWRKYWFRSKSLQMTQISILNAHGNPFQNKKCSTITKLRSQRHTNIRLLQLPYHARDITHLCKFITKPSCHTILDLPGKIYADPVVYGPTINHFLQQNNQKSANVPRKFSNSTIPSWRD